MTIVTNLGFPRIGARRELKHALENYWRGETDAAQLQASAAALRARHWQLQRDAGVDVPPLLQALPIPSLPSMARHYMRGALSRLSAGPASSTDTTPATVKNAADVKDDDMILDVGPKTSALYADILKNAGTIVWNGPVGAFELAAFSSGTKAICDAVAASKAFSIAGGGDTLAAIAANNQEDHISYMSTGGGAFLEFLEGKKLPAVAVLEERGK